MGPYIFHTSGFAGLASNTYNCTSFTCDSITLSSTPIVGQSVTITPTVTNTTHLPIAVDYFQIYGPNFYDFVDFEGGPNSYTVTFPEPGRYRILYGVVTESETDFCYMVLAVRVIPPPIFTISASGSCTATGPIFTITNNGPDDMIAPDTFSIVDGLGNRRHTLAPGNFQLNAGDSTTISLSGLNPYTAYTLTTVGGTITATTDCADPIINVTTVCADTPNFTITNNGGDMLLAQSFTVTDASGNDVTPGSEHVPTQCQAPILQSVWPD